MRSFRDSVATHVSGNLANVDGRELGAKWVGLGLVALLVLTTGAVAWVSIWWVPAYLALMVLIFAMPEGKSQPSRALDEPAGAVSTELGNNLKVECAYEVEPHHLANDLASGPTGGETVPELAGLGSESANPGMAKLQRGRGRARKAPKTAPEPLPDSTPITWIRIGPGKFIRADATSQAVNRTNTEVVVDAFPATDALAPTPPASTVPVTAPEEKGCSDTPELTPGDEGMVIDSNDCMPGPVTEEYGIAPSAFGLISSVDSSIQGPDHHGSGGAVTLEANPGPIANLSGKTSRDGMALEQLRPQRRTSGIRVERVSRGIALGIPCSDQASLRRKIWTRRETRTLAWSSFTSVTRLEQAAHRAFGQMPHVQRAWRPRSPPYR